MDLCSAIRQIKILVKDKLNLKLQADTIVCNGKFDITASSDSSTVFPGQTTVYLIQLILPALIIQIRLVELENFM